MAYISTNDNKLVKRIMDAVTLTGLAAGIGWIVKKVVKNNMTADPSGNVMNYSVCQVHHCHGWQRRAKRVSRGPKDSYHKLKK